MQNIFSGRIHTSLLAPFISRPVYAEDLILGTYFPLDFYTYVFVVPLNVSYIF